LIIYFVPGFHVMLARPVLQHAWQHRRSPSGP
jgi:hypothetical protein